jgi:hypothetical protein
MSDLLREDILVSPILVAYTASVSSGISTLAENKINSFAHLPEGWDYGSGGPITEDTRKIAIAWNDFLRSQWFLSTDASPGSEGEIAIAAGLGDHYIEIIVESDRTVSVAYDFKRKQVLYQSRLSALEARELVMQLVEHIWNVFTSFTVTNIMQQKTGFSERHLRTIGGRYPLSGVNVFAPQGRQPVPTFVNTTDDSHESSASLPFFGDLTQITFPRVAT